MTAYKSQYKAPMRKVLVKAIANERIAGELLDAIIEAQNTLNALIAKLEADKADISTTDFAALAIPAAHVLV